MEKCKILALNFGSTSTKYAVYEDETCIALQVFRHDAEILSEFTTLDQTAQYRMSLILAHLREHGLDLNDFDAVVGRGGLVKPLRGGTYAVNEAMLADLHSCAYGFHVCNLGGMIASDIAKQVGKPAFVVDPPVVDEMDDVAKLSGHPDYPRRALFHALNQKAIAKRFARETGRRYDELNLIVCHMGGGITVGAHRKGRVVDVNNGLEGEGPYSAERPGTLPVFDVLRIVGSGKYGGSYEELRVHFCFDCGLMGYTGTNDGKEITARILAGDETAEQAYRGMAYQISKEIGAMGAVLQGKVDAVLLTGGFANDERLMAWIGENVSYLAPVHIYPGEDEMLSLAQGAIRVLRGEEEVQIYQ